MLESTEDSNLSASLPYGLLISRIIIETLVDLSKYKTVEIFATSDSRTFSSMSYILIDKKWLKKDSLKAKDSIGKILPRSKNTNTEVKKLRLEMDGLKKDRVRTVNKLIKQVDSTKVGADSSNNDLTASVQTYYLNFSKNIKHSFNTFCRNLLNTLNIFLVIAHFLFKIISFV